MKTAAKKVCRKITAKGVVSRMHNEIHDSVIELKDTFPKFIRSSGIALVSMLVIICDVIRIIIFTALKALITVPNGIENFFNAAFAKNKNGKILGILLRLIVIVGIFSLMLSIISAVSFPIGKLAVLNLSIRSVDEQSDVVSDLLQQKDQIYSAKGLTGWLACQPALAKIFGWLLATYMVAMCMTTFAFFTKSLLKITTKSTRHRRVTRSGRVFCR